MVLHKHNKHNNGNHSNHHASNNNSTTNSTSNHLNNNNHINNNVNNVNQTFSTRAVSEIVLSLKFYSRCLFDFLIEIIAHSYTKRIFRIVRNNSDTICNFQREIAIYLSFMKKECKSYRLRQKDRLFNSIRYFFMTARFCKRLFARSRRSSESLDANFASSNGTVFLWANRPVGTGFRRLRQDLEGFLSAERKAARRDAPFGRARGRGEKKIFPLGRKSRLRRKGESYLSQCRNDPEKTRRFRWHRGWLYGSQQWSRI